MRSYTKEEKFLARRIEHGKNRLRALRKQWLDTDVVENVLEQELANLLRQRQVDYWAIKDKNRRNGKRKQ